MGVKSRGGSNPLSRIRGHADSLGIVNAGSSESAERRGAAYWALAALFAMNLLNYIDRNILSALVEPVQQDLGMQGRDALMGFLSTAFFLSSATYSS